MDVFRRNGRTNRRQSLPNKTTAGAADSGFHLTQEIMGDGLVFAPEFDELDDVMLGYEDPDAFHEESDEETDSEETLQEVAEQTTYGLVFLNHLVRRQRALSLSVAITFLAILLSLPLLNFLLRGAGYLEIFGFPVNWLFLAIFIYPLIWALALYFVSTADAYEVEFTKLVK